MVNFFILIPFIVRMD